MPGARPPPAWEEVEPLGLSTETEATLGRSKGRRCREWSCRPPAQGHHRPASCPRPSVTTWVLFPVNPQGCETFNTKLSQPPAVHVEINWFPAPPTLRGNPSHQSRVLGHLWPGTGQGWPLSMSPIV
ncbi:hypothetical protein HJG60_010975 [Phyllostomus discolor]|uniref:Uncharacterized protein n=1 Tax=Phyllostomus discolor TaxID=89673 RepID=A0A834AEB4_9CHIR|nr:hypothetical protein HJG60_010975 [Phyllostomus discolor]